MSYPVKVGIFYVLGCLAGMGLQLVATMVLVSLSGIESGSSAIGMMNLIAFGGGGILAGVIAARSLELGKGPVIGFSIAFIFLCTLFAFSTISLMEYNGKGDLFLTFVVMNGIGFAIAGLIGGISLFQGVGTAVYSAVVFGFGGAAGGLLIVAGASSSAAPALPLLILDPLVSVFIGGYLLARKIES